MTRKSKSDQYEEKPDDLDENPDEDGKDPEDGDYDEDDYEDGYSYRRRSRRETPGSLLTALALVLTIAALGTGYMLLRMRNARERESYLRDSEAAQNAAAAAVLTTSTPDPTPEPTPEAVETAAPAPTEEAEPTPTPEPLLRDTVTAADLGNVMRPDEGEWYDHARSGVVTVDGRMAVRYGPALEWSEVFVLPRDTEVELLAKRGNWLLLRTLDGRYGWGAAELLRDTDPSPTATPAP